MLQSSTPISAPIPPAVVAAIESALFEHECGGSIPVARRISFAEDGESGGSFGRLQNDCHGNRDAAETLQRILTTVLVPAPVIGRILSAVSQACKHNPLSGADERLVDAALDSIQGAAATDQLDRRSLAVVLSALESCIVAAAENGESRISASALLGMAIWINAAGPPSVLLEWLRGKPVALTTGSPRRLALGQLVLEDDLLDYLAKTLEFSRRPGLIKPLTEAVGYGLASVPDGAVPSA
jgi:hypothetical protein